MSNAFTIVVHKVSVENSVEALEKQVTTSQTDYLNLPLEDVTPKDAPHLE